MSKVYSDAQTVEAVAKGIVPNFHAHLATARIRYIFVDKAGKKGGQEQYGKVQKLSGALEYLLESDFLVEVAEPKWSELTPEQQKALTDHLLERLWGEEDDKTGEMKWTLREPDVQEFATILRRHGAWNAALTGFVSVAQSIQLDEIVQEETELNVDELLNATEGTDEP